MQKDRDRVRKSKYKSKSSNPTIKSDDVYNMLLTIPAGMVSTYGDFAKALGNPGASRRIGKILSENPNPIEVPCHRVVKSDGMIGGFALGISKKKELLENEGLLFVEGLKVSDFENKRFRPEN